MKYYKKLDLEFETVAKKTLEYATFHKDKIKTFWTDINFENFIKHVPELLTLFKEMNITPRRVALTTALADVSIHRDDTSVPVRINIPILNCKGSKTKFWKTSVEPTRQFLENNTPYLYIAEEDCELADILELDVPTVLRVKEPHSVCVGEKVPRMSLTIEFVENIECLLD